MHRPEFLNVNEVLYAWVALNEDLDKSVELVDNRDCW
jgi:hypothetical protein